VIVSNDKYEDEIFEEEYKEIKEKKQVYLEIIFLLLRVSQTIYLYIYYFHSSLVSYAFLDDGKIILANFISSFQ